MIKIKHKGLLQRNLQIKFQSTSVSSLDSEVEKCKSKPEVTFLLIILNFLCDCTNEKKRKFQAHKNGEKCSLLLLLTEKLYTQTSQLKANYVVHFHTAPAKKSRKMTA